ncbi:hypothetical protein HK096_006314 [Nowakowskiella sp. JEL0078]|nr:hypothetical protein HK096_006314 [Nowakowskiella sp. JEL0078]
MPDDINILFPPFPSPNVHKAIRILQLIAGIIYVSIVLKNFIDHHTIAAGLIWIILSPFHVICLFFAFKNQPVASINQLLVRRRWVLVLDVVFSLVGAAFFIWELITIVIYGLRFTITFYVPMCCTFLLLIASASSVYFLSKSLMLLSKEIQKNTATYTQNLPPPSPAKFLDTPPNMLQANFPYPVPQTHGENNYIHSMPVGYAERAPGENTYIPVANSFLSNSMNNYIPTQEGYAYIANTEAVISMENRQKELELVLLREKIRMQQLDKELLELKAQT